MFVLRYKAAPTEHGMKEFKSNNGETVTNMLAREKYKNA